MADTVTGLMEEARTSADNHSWDEAIELYSKVLEQDIDNDEACRQLARLYAVRGKFKSVIESNLRLMRVFINRQDIENAVQVANQLLLLVPESIEVRQELIKMYRSLGDMPEVIARSTELARLYAELDESDKALELLQSVLRDDPQNVEVGREVAEMYIQSGQVEQGASRYRQVADLYEAQGEYDKAIDAIQRVLVVNNNDSNSIFHLGELFVKLERWDEAERQFRNTLKFNFENTEVMFALGDVCQRKGDLDQAALAYRKIVAMTPDFVQAQEKLGEVYQLQGNGEQAIKSYLSAANLYLRAHQPEKAISLYQRVLYFDNNNPTATRELTNLGAPVTPDDGGLQPVAKGKGGKGKKGKKGKGAEGGARSGLISKGGSARAGLMTKGGAKPGLGGKPVLGGDEEGPGSPRPGLMKAGLKSLGGGKMSLGGKPALGGKKTLSRKKKKEVEEAAAPPVEEVVEEAAPEVEAPPLSLHKEEEEAPLAEASAEPAEPIVEEVLPEAQGIEPELEVEPQEYTPEVVPEPYSEEVELPPVEDEGEYLGAEAHFNEPEGYLEEGAPYRADEAEGAASVEQPYEEVEPLPGEVTEYVPASEETLYGGYDFQSGEGGYASETLPPDPQPYEEEWTGGYEEAQNWADEVNPELHNTVAVSQPSGEFSFQPSPAPSDYSEEYGQYGEEAKFPVEEVYPEADYQAYDVEGYQMETYAEEQGGGEGEFHHFAEPSEESGAQGYEALPAQAEESEFVGSYQPAEEVEVPAEESPSVVEPALEENVEQAWGGEYANWEEHSTEEYHAPQEEEAAPAESVEEAQPLDVSAEEEAREAEEAPSAPSAMDLRGVSATGMRRKGRERAERKAETAPSRSKLLGNDGLSERMARMRAEGGAETETSSEETGDHHRLSGRAARKDKKTRVIMGGISRSLEQVREDAAGIVSSEAAPEPPRPALRSANKSRTSALQERIKRARRASKQAKEHASEVAAAVEEPVQPTSVGETEAAVVEPEVEPVVHQEPQYAEIGESVAEPAAEVQSLEGEAQYEGAYHEEVQPLEGEAQYEGAYHEEVQPLEGEAQYEGAYHEEIQPLEGEAQYAGAYHEEIQPLEGEAQYEGAYHEEVQPLEGEAQYEGAYHEEVQPLEGELQYAEPAPEEMAATAAVAAQEEGYYAEVPLSEAERLTGEAQEEWATAEQIIPQEEELLGGYEAEDWQGPAPEESEETTYSGPAVEEVLAEQVVEPEEEEVVPPPAEPEPELVEAEVEEELPAASESVAEDVPPAEETAVEVVEEETASIPEEPAEPESEAVEAQTPAAEVVTEESSVTPEEGAALEPAPVEEERVEAESEPAAVETAETPEVVAEVQAEEVPAEAEVPASEEVTEEVAEQVEPAPEEPGDGLCSLAIESELPSSYLEEAQVLRERLAGADVTTSIGDYRRAVENSPENLVLRTDLADIHLHFGLFDDAINQYRQIIRRKPDSVALRHRLANAYLWSEDFEEAAKVYLELVELHNKNEQYADAVDVLQTVLSLDPQNFKARGLLIERFIAEGKMDLAIHHLRQFVETSLSLGSVEYAISALKQLIAISDDPAFMERLAKVYEEHNNAVEALVYYRQLLDRYYGEKKWAEALATCEKLVSLEPQNFEKRHMLIELYQNLGRYDQVISSQFALALLYKDENMIDEAAKLLEEIIKRDPTHYEARRRLVDCYLAQNNLAAAMVQVEPLTERYQSERLAAAAIDMYTQLVAADPESVELREKLLSFYTMDDQRDNMLKELLALAEIHEKRSEYRDSVRFLRRAIELAPERVDLHCRLAKLYDEQLHSMSGAMQVYKKIFELAPGDAHTMRRYAQLLVDQRKAKEAATVLLKLQSIDKAAGKEVTEEICSSFMERISQDSSDLSLRYIYGELCYYLNRISDAIEQFQKTHADRDLELRSRNMLGLSFIKMPRMREMAIRQFRLGLDTKGHPEQDYLELRYNLAMLFYQTDRLQEALTEFKSILAFDVTYRDVEARVKELQAKIASGGPGKGRSLPSRRK